MHVSRGTHCSTHGAFVAVVCCSLKAVFAEGVATGCGHRLVQQLHAQDAFKVVLALRHAGSADLHRLVNIRPATDDMQPCVCRPASLLLTSNVCNACY